MHTRFEAIIKGCPACGHGERVHCIVDENRQWKNVPGSDSSEPDLWWKWLERNKADIYDVGNDMFTTFEDMLEYACVSAKEVNDGTA